ncbi:MAG TPA: 3-hydroxyacyl-ACP dehydratase FabZ [Solimonas sp.]
MDKTTFDIRDILTMLPHRYPFLLVDRVLDVDAEAGRLTAIKNVTYNEPYFPGHFPGLPTMPGVIMLEAMAQACGLLAIIKSGLRADSGLILYFAGIDNCRFKRPVVPGDQLRFAVTLDKHKRDLWKFTAEARVGEELACAAEMMCVLKDPSRGTDGG